MALSLVHADVSVFLRTWPLQSVNSVPQFIFVVYCHSFGFYLYCFAICLLVLPVLVTKFAAPKAWSKSQLNIFQLSYDLIKTRA